MSKEGRFWRNVTLIALAHLALIAGLIRWTVAARSALDAENLIWLSGTEDIEAGATKREARPEPAASTPLPEPKTLKTDEAEEEKPLVTAAKSEIGLPTPKRTSTPKPAPMSTPKAMAKPSPKPTPRKIVLTKTSKSSTTAKSSVSKSKEAQTNANTEKTKSMKTASSKTKSSSDSGNGKTGSAGKGASGSGGGSNASEFGWYGNMLHDRFYSAWIQPTTSVPSGAKISTLVKVRIEKDGRVSKFEIIKPSENVVVNESVAAIAKRVSEVDAPPAGLVKGDYYDVRINFELNTGEGMENQ
jgi:outer membrane biosynthesis protein TonB